MNQPIGTCLLIGARDRGVSEVHPVWLVQG